MLGPLPPDAGRRRAQDVQFGDWGVARVEVVFVARQGDLGNLAVVSANGASCAGLSRPGVPSTPNPIPASMKGVARSRRNRLTGPSVLPSSPHRTTKSLGESSATLATGRTLRGRRDPGVSDRISRRTAAGSGRPSTDSAISLDRTSCTGLSPGLRGGLRQRNGCELLVRDANLGTAAPTILATWKGGRRPLLPARGRWRTASARSSTGPPGTRGPPPQELCSAFGSDLVRQGRKAGPPGLSAHDRRRTLGRMLCYEGHANLNTIRVL